MPTGDQELKPARPSSVVLRAKRNGISRSQASFWKAFQKVALRKDQAPKLAGG